MSDLQELSQLALKLNKATEEVNEILKHAETKLRATGIGISARTNTPIFYGESQQTGDDLYQEIVFLGWDKLSDWKLVAIHVLRKKLQLQRQIPDFTNSILIKPEFQKYIETVDIQIKISPLLEAPRTIRIAAVGKLDMLLKDIKNEATKILETVESGRNLKI